MKTIMEKSNMKNIILGLVMTLVLFTLSACGGGGSGTAVKDYSTATVKISLNGDLGGKGIIGAEFTMTLPENVTPAMVSGTVAASVVTPSGTFAGSSIAPIITYLPATGTTKGTVGIVLSSSVPAGVTTAGEVATVTLKLANGVVPAAADFKLDTLPVKVIDTFGNPILGMTATIGGVTLQ
jgi:hypothetical protein